MPSRASPRTPEELLAKRLADPAYQGEPLARAQQRANRHAAIDRDSWPILQELAEVGYDHDSIGWFVNTRELYPTAIPILHKHLVLPHLVVTRGSLIRSLAVRDARGTVAKTIVQLLDEHLSEAGWAKYAVPDETYFPETSEQHSIDESRMELCTNLSVTADPSVHDDIVRLLGDPRLSRWSKYLKQALATSKKK